MSTFQDGTGYLLALRDSVNQGWFHAITDLAIGSVGGRLNDTELAKLWDLFHGFGAIYQPVAMPAVPLPVNSGSPSSFLSELSGFDGFKKLSPGLRLDLTKQLTLVFGKNGSGKSSLCQALRILASPEEPKEPVRNVRLKPSPPASFSYRFSKDGTTSRWTEATGYGARAAELKYFDSVVALRHINGAVRPETVVEVSAFRLEVFEYARAAVAAFQAYAAAKVNERVAAHRARIRDLKSAIAGRVNVESEPFATWTESTANVMAGWLANVAEYDSTKAAEASTLVLRRDQYALAASDSGLTTLKAQLALLGQLDTELRTLKRHYDAAQLRRLQFDAAAYFQKEAAQAELARSAFPNMVDASAHQAMVEAAAGCTDLVHAQAGLTICPLCLSTLSQAGADLFRVYHNYLNNTLRADLEELGSRLRVGTNAIEQIHTFKLSDFSSCRNVFKEGFFESLIGAISSIKAALPAIGALPSAGDANAFEAASSFDIFIAENSRVASDIASAISEGSNNRAGLLRLLENCRSDLAALDQIKALNEHRKSISDICAEGLAMYPVVARFQQYDFTALLRSMTNKGKEAHTALIMASFEQQLNREYVSLCGSTLDQMGVRLSSRGANQDVIVTPQVGDSPVYRVLSEGEQKVHALAIFMCEAEAAPHQVLVLDDPVTSFDYNYIGNFCTRIRDFVRAHPGTQIVALTHNWDFFVGLQSAMNKASLDAKMSVQVLEDCATVAEYVEKWDELCAKIDPIVNASLEPSADAKEMLAGYMRRLIERLTNQYVFNEQRHQYKVKTLSVSEFEKFTKVVALLNQEASDLRDLFGYLSPTEHDDIRNFYSTKSGQQYKAWYDKICAIKMAVESRRPV